MNGVDFDAVVANAVAEILSGAAPLAALFAVLIAVPVSLGVLAFFRYRVRRSMTPKSSSTPKGEPKPEAAPLASDRATRPPIEWHQLEQAATDHRAGLARLYIWGGVGLAAALAVVDAVLNTGEAPFSPRRFLYAAICFSTPLALIIRLLYGRWKPTFVLVGCQLAAVLVLGAFGPGVSGPQDSYHAPAFAILVSPMLALLLHPRIRAMGPLATGFFTVVLAGAFVSMAASIFLLRDYVRTNILANPQTSRLLEAFDEVVSTKDERQAQLFNDAAFSYLRDNVFFIFQTFAIVILVGVLASAAVGALLFFLVTRSYACKIVSEQWLVIASVWLYLAIAVASVFTPVGLPANLACLAVVGVGVAGGWRRLPRHQGPNVRLLLLRSFSLRERSNRLFQDLESLWRSIGSIQLVGAVDIALTTLEPHELLDFLRGRLGREFVHSPAEVDARLALFDHERDPDGRFRVNVIFCGGDSTWQYAVDRMLRDSDCVLMDLRGFSRHRAGCVFEIRCLAGSDRSFRTVFLVDESTDRGFVGETWTAAAKVTSGSADGDAFRFVSEQPSQTVAERIIAAFASADARHDSRAAPREG